MASIRKLINKDGTTSHRVEVRLKGFPPQRATFKRLTDARKWAQHTESAIREGRYFKTAEAKKHTFSELAVRFINEVLPKKSPHAASTQKAQILWWKEQLGDYVLADVTPARITEGRDKLLTGTTKRGYQRSPSTVVRYMAALSHAFTIAVNEWGWLEDSPMRKVKKPTEPRGRVRFLSDDERERLLQACEKSDSPYLYPVFVLAISTGMRQGEIMGLTWDAVDLHQGRITLHHTKNGEIRVVPLVGKALELLKDHAKVKRIDTPLLFPGRAKPNKPIDLRSPWRAALKAAGIEDFRFHDTRHSTASYLVMNGASLAEVSEVLGHKSLEMVKRYAHLSEAHTASVMTRLNEKLFG
ncbi:site-specific integrase [Gammaproteobacteria bacterium]|nr:site-specific integrase [Gammaproteobacteria bacterium]